MHSEFDQIIQFNYRGAAMDRYTDNLPAVWNPATELATYRDLTRLETSRRMVDVEAVAAEAVHRERVRGQMMVSAGQDKDRQIAEARLIHDRKVRNETIKNLRGAQKDFNKGLRREW